YKDLPVSLFQIQPKYRDEARPRAGLLRGREFVMKDSYSFDIDEAGLQASYDAHRAAYIRIFDRLGLDYVIVQATSGAMGGSASEEFLAVADNGEDTFVRSPGGFAANVEAVRREPGEALDHTDAPAAHVEDTPDAATIDDLVRVANERVPRADRPWAAGDTLKNVLFMLHHPDGGTEPLAIGLPGDREVDAKRLEAAIEPAVAVPFGEEDFAAYPRLVKGYVGPQVLGIGELAEDEAAPAGAIRYLVDPAVVDGSRWVTGANEAGKHVFDLVAGRDFTADAILDVAELREGDPAPDGSGPMTLARGIEMGHIFQLGRKYAEALDLQVLDANGKRAVVTMGSYGIGVSRAVAAVAEATSDDAGLCWPRELAPFDVHVLATGKGEEIAEAAEKLATELAERGLEVLLDDRKASPGVKFADAEVLGMPTSVVVGRGLTNGVVELRNRASGDRDEVPVAEAVDRVLAVVRG
ncbi:MAG: proline--tRNA ligase, partial [Propionibacterium sp.]|nr:proline--tRNA ligase [Propionibacterium sp.]